MSPKYTEQGQGPFALIDYDKYKKKLRNKPKLQMFYAYKAEYGEEPKDIDEMITGCKAMELRIEQAKDES